MHQRWLGHELVRLAYSGLNASCLFGFCGLENMKIIRKSRLCESNREWNREVQEHSSSLKLYQAWVPTGTPLLPNYIGPDTLIMSKWKILTLSALLWEIMLYLWSIWHTDLNIKLKYSILLLLLSVYFPTWTLFCQCGSISRAVWDS